ncbi:programmed cell death protein 2-like isoform X2 [Scophthalmus maximus]|uniref:programmed cell death protein 2-like isoform X2 n=1 Tax=Scophthalmus maximus TaxID=52904 RepID=UPI001FA86A6B|nr:programmed cell death protein 2-like isoform X2 [Scophthalmus maximus]
MSSGSRDVSLVGVCDGELDPGRHRPSCVTNKVGGLPDWLPGVSRQCPRCGRCGAPLALVSQVYCPLDASPFHRNLHVFACPGAECSGGPQGWRVLRSQGLETQVGAAPPHRPAPAQEAPLSATDWCDTADDWGVEEEEEEEEDEGWAGGGGVKKDQVEEEAAAEAPSLSGRLQDLSLGASHQDVVPVFRSFFISVVDESDLCGGEDDDCDLAHAQELLREYERREGVAVGEMEGGGGGEEKYEKSRARHGDNVFSRFMKTISPCPQQVLRYCRGGRPLVISEPPADLARAVPACGSCGGPRTFELQLMPALVSLLQRTRKDGGAEAELDFGTLLVYTCVNSCWTTGSGAAVDEFCFAQADPDQQLFK